MYTICQPLDPVERFKSFLACDQRTMKLHRIRVLSCGVALGLAGLLAVENQAVWGQEAKPQVAKPKETSKDESKVQWKKLLPASGLEG